jgi:hypothetical protein
MAPNMKGLIVGALHITLFLCGAAFAQQPNAAETLPQHQRAQLNLPSCTGHESIHWDTATPLVIEFRGKSLSTAGQLLKDLRSVDQIPNFLAQLWDYCSYIYSEVVFSLLDERLHPIYDAAAHYKGSVHSLERTAFGSIQGEQTSASNTHCSVIDVI